MCGLIPLIIVIDGVMSGNPSRRILLGAIALTVLGLTGLFSIAFSLSHDTRTSGDN